MLEEIRCSLAKANSPALRVQAAATPGSPATLRVRGGGCGSSKVTPSKLGVGESGVVAVVGSSAPPPPEAPAATEPEALPAAPRARTTLQLAAEEMVAKVDLASLEKPSFAQETPMLVMKFDAFKKQLRICKSTRAWREEVQRKGWLIEYDPAMGQIAIFISQTCEPHQEPPDCWRATYSPSIS